MTWRGTSCALALLVGLGCQARRHADGPAGIVPVRGAPPASTRHLPLPPDRLAELLRTATMELRSMERTPQGVMGVAHAVAHFVDADVDIEVKWKESPSGDADGWNNSPRKELAAYEVQRWFLRPADYPVPPAAVRCLPLDEYRRFVPGAEPTIEGTRCVLGLVSAWVLGAEGAEDLYDPERFLADEGYAHHLANLNLLLHLIEHRDGRLSNFLVAEDPGGRRVFAIDNGIAFGGIVYNFLSPSWDVIRVPALPRASVDRLRRTGARDLEGLAVVAELAVDGAGVLRNLPPGPVEDPTAGTRVRPGHVQMGLTRDEIAAVAERVEALLAGVDAGEISLF